MTLANRRSLSAHRAAERVQLAEDDWCCWSHANS